MRPVVYPNTPEVHVEILKERLRQEREHRISSDECLIMVQETLEGLGTDMGATPAMFFPEAIVATVRRKMNEAVRDAPAEKIVRPSDYAGEQPDDQPTHP